MVLMGGVTIPQNVHLEKGIAPRMNARCQQIYIQTGCRAKSYFWEDFAKDRCIGAVID